MQESKSAVYWRKRYEQLKRLREECKECRAVVSEMECLDKKMIEADNFTYGTRSKDVKTMPRKAE